MNREPPEPHLDPPLLSGNLSQREGTRLFECQNKITQAGKACANKLVQDQPAFRGGHLTHLFLFGDYFLDFFIKLLTDKTLTLCMLGYFSCFC